LRTSFIVEPKARSSPEKMAARMVSSSPPMTSPARVASGVTMPVIVKIGVAAGLA
jgi:hypothetical protein